MSAANPQLSVISPDPDCPQPKPDVVWDPAPGSITWIPAHCRGTDDVDELANWDQRTQPDEWSMTHVSFFASPKTEPGLVEFALTLGAGIDNHCACSKTATLAIIKADIVACDLSEEEEDVPPGLVVPDNKDDDNTVLPGCPDKDDPLLEGPDPTFPDDDDLQPVWLDWYPGEIPWPECGLVRLAILDDCPIRVFRHPNRTSVLLHENRLANSWPLTETGDETKPPRIVFVEGFRPGTCRLRLEYEVAGAIHADELVVTVPAIDLDIERLGGALVPEGQDEQTGTITMMVPPEGDPAWRVGLHPRPDPTLPADIEYLLRKKPVPANDGNIRVYHDGTMVLSDTDTEAGPFAASELVAGTWQVEGTETGAVDLHLVGTRCGREFWSYVRVLVIIVPPKPGAILIADAAKPQNFATCDWAPHPKIAAALAAAAADANVVVARAFYAEGDLLVPQQVLCVGLGGDIDWSAAQEYNKFQADKLPVVSALGTRRVFVVSGLGTVLAALEITNGQAHLGAGVTTTLLNGALICYNYVHANTATYGGGIYAMANVDINHNVLELNRATQETPPGQSCDEGAGGGIYIYDTPSATVDANRIRYNWALVYGGGIGSMGDTAGVSAVVQRNLLYHNDAGVAGGGIATVVSFDCPSHLIANNPVTDGPFCLWGGLTLDIRSNDIIGNTTGTYYEEAEGRGGGIYIGGTDSKPTIQDNTIRGNSAHGNGGGVCGFCGSTITAAGNLIRDNTVDDDGGGISQSGWSRGVWQGNTIDHNSAFMAGSTAGDNGGGVHGSIRSTFESTGNIIMWNSAIESGGGVYMRNAPFLSHKNNAIVHNLSLGANGRVGAGGHGGGIAMVHTGEAGDLFGNARLTLTHDVVHDNIAYGHGGALYFDEAKASNWGSYLTATSTMLRTNVAGSSVGTSAAPSAGLYAHQVGSISLSSCVFRTHDVGAAVVLHATRAETPTVEYTMFDSNLLGLHVFDGRCSAVSNQLMANTIHAWVDNAWWLRMEYNTFGRAGQTVTGVVVDRSDYFDYQLWLRYNNFIGHNLSASSRAVAVTTVVPGSLGFYRIDAHYNWWNDPGGPHDPSAADGYTNFNPPGDVVTDGVDYSSWRSVPN